MSSLGNKQVMAQNIKMYMEDKGISRKEFCKRLGFAYSTVTDWLNAEKYPRIDKIEMMANFFGVSKADLVEPHTATPAQPPAQKVTRYTYRIPVVGRVAAGQPILAQEEIIDYEYIDERLHKGGDQYFGLVVKGSSMEPTIHDGDTIIVRVQETVENGQIAVVLVDGEDATVKEVKESEEGLTLIGHNVAVYTPHFYSREEVEKLPIRIIGRVIQSISKF